MKMMLMMTIMLKFLFVFIYDCFPTNLQFRDKQHFASVYSRSRAACQGVIPIVFCDSPRSASGLI